MTVIYTIAGVALVYYGLRLFLASLGIAVKTAEGDIKPKDAAIGAISGFFIILVGVVLFLQNLATVGQGSMADDPYSFEWVKGIIKDLMTGKLPQLGNTP